MINTLKCTFKWVIRIKYPYKRIKSLTKVKKSVKLYIPEDNILGAYYNAIRNNTVHRLHIPHSSVFYVRAAIEAKTGVKYTLQHVESAMLAEGMLSKHYCI